VRPEGSEKRDEEMHWEIVIEFELAVEGLDERVVFSMLGYQRSTSDTVREERL
jgi:hypothetical protein